MLLIFRLAWRPVNDLPFVDQKDVPVIDQSAGNSVIMNIVGITGGLSNALRRTLNHVPSRRKTTADVTRPIDWRTKMNNRLYLSNRTSQSKHLIDTMVDHDIRASLYFSSTAFRWPFITAVSLSQPIIEADFLRHYGG
ncbi:hypothetical protein TNIN_215231 [Trichonephila inaurata madagascariensis]|uniref:Uncharacterized protein n=1 Tax=Trichonephila inaurata madagascariensis TaxID=2747483 RepID=A0A8X6XSB1_9ARAC|nr:hypothetical protein TNIN_215231 [Trichonephila inaurata madagascariensis]